MQKKRAFTLIELLVVVSIIALLIGLLLPALANARNKSRQMQNSAQVKGIHTGIILLAQSNKGCYVGLNSDGTRDTGVLDNAQGRLAALVNKNFFTTEYTQSPSETTPSLFIATLPNLQVTTSYALPQIADNLGNINLTGSRIVEWRQTENSDAPVISDRLKSGNTNFGANGVNPISNNTNIPTYQSIHTSKNGDWRGSVGYNDNHVNFEAQAVLTTAFNGEMPASSLTNYYDDIFDGGNGVNSNGSCFRNFQGYTNDTQAGPLDDTYFVWKGSTVP